MNFARLETLPDPATDPRLLPTAMAGRDNSRRIRHYKTALSKAMSTCLTPAQRTQIRLHYEKGLRKSQIAELQKSSCSAVSKSMKRSLTALRNYIAAYMEIYDTVERDFLRRDDE